jgi:hypothetical protein
MAHSQEAVDLVRLLAVQLAAFRRYERDGRRHLARTVFDVSYCSSEADPRFYRACSARCTATGEALELAARWVGCEIDDFYPQPKPKRRKAASAPHVLAHITEEMTS